MIRRNSRASASREVMANRTKMFVASAAGMGRRRDWPTPESSRKPSIRITGQDSRRGTFFHRHAVLHEQTTGENYVRSAPRRAEPRSGIARCCRKAWSGSNPATDTDPSARDWERSSAIRERRARTSTRSSARRSEVGQAVRFLRCAAAGYEGRGRHILGATRAVPEALRREQMQGCVNSTPRRCST